MYGDVFNPEKYPQVFNKCLWNTYQNPNLPGELSFKAHGLPLHITFWLFSTTSIRGLFSDVATRQRKENRNFYPNSLNWNLWKLETNAIQPIQSHLHSTHAWFTWFIGMNGQHGRKHLAKLMFCILKKKKKEVVLFYPLQYQTEPPAPKFWYERLLVAMQLYQ